MTGYRHRRPQEPSPLEAFCSGTLDGGLMGIVVGLIAWIIYAECAWLMPLPTF